MKIRNIILAAAVALIPVMASAQGTVNDLTTDFGARVSASIDKKLMKGLHVSAEAEARMSDNFSTFGRYDFGVGIAYKVSPYFKIGGGYILINKLNSDSEWKMRHRVYLDASTGLRAGAWRFSLKERLQLTHRDVNNIYQNNPNSVTLKSRLKVSYKGFGTVEPYGYVELRNVFNDPSCSATWSTTSEAYTDYSFTGYTDAYLNRVRGCLGAEVELSKSHALDFYLLTDYCYEKEVDTNSSGTKLKSLTYDQSLNTAICVGYKFKF